MTTYEMPSWMTGLVAGTGVGEAVWPDSPQPPPEGGRASAVLILFGPAVGGGEDVLLTERAADLRSHAGQVSFPGGSMDPGDGGSGAVAALREAEEEVGLDPAGVRVVGELRPVFLAQTGYVVTPVLGWWERPSVVGVVDASEVARVVRVPVAELVDPANRFSVTHPSGYVGPGFQAGGLFVWGFTGRLLNGLLEVAGLARPWDAGRRRELDSRLLPVRRSVHGGSR